MATHAERIAKLAYDLKPNHRKFADLVLAEVSLTDAYLEVYDTDPVNPLTRRSATESASRLLGKPKVRAYIEAVNEAAIDEVIINRAEVIAALADVIASGVTQGPGAGARVSACKIMLDLLAGGEKHTVTLQGPGGGPIETVTRKGMSESTANEIKRMVLGIVDKPDDS